MERELTLKDILIIGLKKAKAILICTLICGVAAAGYGLISSPSAEAHAAAAESSAAEAKLVEQALLLAQERQAALEEYKQNSLYYTIDPYNEACCSIQFSVDPEEAPNGEPTGNSAYRAAAAYASLYREDAEIMQQVAWMLGVDIDAKYAEELIDITVSNGNQVRITVVYRDTDTAEKIADYLFSATEKLVSDTVMPHSTAVISDSVAYRIDDVMQEKQTAVDVQLAAVQKDIDAKELALGALRGSSAFQPLRTVKLSRTAKYGVIGLVIGFILACGVALIACILGGRFENTADAARYEFPLLGTLPQDGGRRWFGRWLRHLENDPRISREAAVSVLAANLDVVAKDKRIALAGACDQAVLDGLAQDLGNAVLPAGNVLENAGAVEALQQADCVLLVEARGKSRIQSTDELVERLKALDKEVVGIVLA